MTTTQKHEIATQIALCQRNLIDLNALWKDLGDKDRRALYPSISDVREAINGIAYLGSKLLTYDAYDPEGD